MIVDCTMNGLANNCVAVSGVGNSSSENVREDGDLVSRGGEQGGIIAKIDELQLVGVPVVVEGGGSEVKLEKMEKVEMGIVVKEEKVEMKIEEMSVGKKKRGRPSRAQEKPPAKTAPKVEDEEDVCFICFDGGDLVLCDRRGCPKAYHPACIKRDEAFFQSNAKWNCGWHLCSNCEKASHYMCYTCTFSLCKKCVKSVDILCVKGTKGFCTTCMRTIMLIENAEQGNKDLVQVDFDDKSSWEYLFKVYWIYLKTKLSLTLDEITKAENPGKGAVLVAPKTEPQDQPYIEENENDYSPDSFSGYQEGKEHQRKKKKVSVKKESLITAKTYHEGVEWASKELLDFVAHMKNGDTSVLSQFDVQALMLDYIKNNDLRDPRRKSQIICDSRLINMFGKARVGHFEMLKLLEYHLLNTENHSQVKNIIQGGVIASSTTAYEIDNRSMAGKEKRRKTRKMGADRKPQTNLDEYAAIDVHNISLIYLKRNVIESLIDDLEKFEGKVVGSIVRIKIFTNDQKQDYRLVRVVGTSKVAVPYKVGEKMVDTMLEILNLTKKEIISIDEISNQDFSKDECTRLRQSIKFGLIKRFTVGEILDKAVALQAVRVNDWLEAETLRLNHLRDRASEKGHRKDLRECVEKLQVLNTPEERQRRELEIPEVHADPRMDPSYDSEESGESNHKKQDDDVGPSSSNPRKSGRKPISQQRVIKTPLVKKVRPKKISHQDRNNSPIVSDLNNQAVVKLESNTVASSEIPTLPFSNDNSEIEKLWHYRDPAGNIQGPFSMLQLRKWSACGYFPPHLTVWKVNEKENNSLLLTDVMNIQNPLKEAPLALQILPAHSPLNPLIPSTNTEKASLGCTDQELSHGNQDITAVIQSNKTGSSNNQITNSDEPSKQDWKVPPLDFFLKDGNFPSNFVSEAKSIEKLLEKNDKIEIPDLPSPTPNPTIVDLNVIHPENKQTIPSNTGTTWRTEPQIPVVASDWSGYSPTPLKPPSVEEWATRPDSSTSLKPTIEFFADLNALPTHSSPSHPVATTSDWRDILAGPNEFPLAEESVSDLLAEVDAMETLFGPPSPTSAMNCSVDIDMTLGEKDQCFSSMEVMSHTVPENGKTDAHMPCQFDVTRSNRHCSNSDDVAKAAVPKQKTVSVSETEVCSENHPLESSSASWDMPVTESTDTSRGQVQQNQTALNWPVQININMGWGNVPGNVPQANANINWSGIPPGNVDVVWPNQPTFVPDRFSGQRDRGYGRDNRPSWNRQSSFGSNGGGNGSGGSFRPSPKGQRICKFYESGRCKKGAFCDYLHP